ncbi:MAG: pilus assembly protein [Robiginitomaculum sp.]|nr:MAG: pilus assembly protein [Robiginitomaculum sp.]
MFRTTGFVLALSLFFLLPAHAREEEESFAVEVDKAKVLRLPRAASAVIVGNPAIADAAVHNGRILFITGKIYGNTNIIALDARGNTILERTISVSAPKMAAITYYRGGLQRSYTCAGLCEPTPSIGDDKDLFNKLLKQQESKTEQGNTAALPE